MYESNSFPQEWGCSTITPVYKSEDRNTGGNYRGITIQLVISKLYSIVLMTRIERWAIHNNLIPDAQFSFRKYKSQYTWLYLYSENMHRCQNSRTMPVHLFIDFCKAFDRVCQNCLLRKLGKPQRKQTPISSMQQEGWRSKWPIVRPEPNRKWARQGCPLSKLLKEGGCIVVTLGTSQINFLLFAIRL